MIDMENPKALFDACLDDVDRAALLEAPYVAHDYGGDESWHGVPIKRFYRADVDGDICCAMGVLMHRHYWVDGEEEDRDIPSTPPSDASVAFLYERFRDLCPGVPAPADFGPLVDWFQDGFDTAHFRGQTPQEFLSWALQQETLAAPPNSATVDRYMDGHFNVRD